MLLSTQILRFLAGFFPNFTVFTFRLRTKLRRDRHFLSPFQYPRAALRFALGYFLSPLWGLVILLMTQNPGLRFACPGLLYFAPLGLMRNPGWLIETRIFGVNAGSGGLRRRAFVGKSDTECPDSTKHACTILLFVKKIKFFYSFPCKRLAILGAEKIPNFSIKRASLC